MTTAYTSLLGLALPVTGELSGTWGDTVNNSITSLLDTSVAGTTNVSTDTDVTLTTTTGAANTARQAILLFSGARTALRTVTAPAQSKIYTVINATTGGYSVQLVGSGPTTGVTILAGESAVCAWNGSDFVKVSNAGGSSSFVNLTVSGNLTLSGGTANGVAYLNGSKVVTSGSALTFDGSSLGVGVASPTQLIDGTATNPRLKLTATSTGYAASQFANTSGSSYFGRDNSTGGFFGIANGTVVYSSTNDPIGFFLGTNEQMRLTSTGLGIGTSSPGTRLDVEGTTQIRHKYTGAPERFSIGQFNASGDASINNIANAPLLFATNNTERMRLDSSGNLGLGVTPSAWGFGGNLELPATNNISFQGSYGNILSNAYYDLSQTRWEYTSNGYAAQYQIGSGGQHIWLNAPSGTAGNAITFTQAMTLNASGQLLVGATSAAGSERLNIVGGSGIRVNEDGVGTKILTIRSDYAGLGPAINVTTTDPLLFLTANTERARIDSSGNLLVGTSDPSDSAGPGVKIRNNSGDPYVVNVRSQSTDSYSTYAAYSSSVGTYRFYVGFGGTIFATSTSISAISDATLKENVRDLETGLTEVMALKPRRFDWKNGDAQNVAGFIAQEVEQVLPELVSDYKYSNTETKKSLKMGDILPTLVKAIQEQQAIINQLKARLDAANL